MPGFQSWSDAVHSRYEKLRQGQRLDFFVLVVADTEFTTTGLLKKKKKGKTLYDST